MYLAIDIVLIAVMAAAVIKAVKRGFVASLFSLLSVAVSVILAVMFYKELGIYINDEFVYKHVSSYVTDIVTDIANSNGGTVNGETLVGALPEGLRNAADVLGIDLSGAAEGFSGIPMEVAESLSVQISAAASNVLAFVSVFFLALISLSIICFVLDSFAKLPVLHGINKIFGFLFGVAEALILGVLIAKVALALCSVYGTLNNDVAFLEAAEKTTVAKFLVSIFPW